MLNKQSLISHPKTISHDDHDDHNNTDNHLVGLNGNDASWLPFWASASRRRCRDAEQDHTWVQTGKASALM